MATRALIFDVDGTMADTEEAHRVAFNLAFERLRLSWRWEPSDYREMLKVHGGKERMASFIETLSVDDAERKRLLDLVPRIHVEKTRFYSSFVSEGAVPLRPGVARLLDEALAAGCRLAIASTTTAINVHALLVSTVGPRGLDMFSVIACGDEVHAKKPSPDIYRLVLQRLDVAPNEAIAFEDSTAGLRAAQAAGLWTVITPNFWTVGSNFDSADLLLPNLGDPLHPLPGEPGRRLESAAWLTFDELARRGGMATDTRPRASVQVH
ncbi:MAG: HAD-IA family hydrolase [Burkholderiaceae bacterium]